MERTQGLALLGQSQLNELVGNVYANKNVKYPNITMGMAGNYAHFDIAPQETVDMNILSTDTNTRIPIHAPYMIDSVSWTFDTKNKIRLPSIDFTALVNGVSGETITIPDIPDGGGYSDFDGGFGGFHAGAFPPFLSSLVGIQGVWKGRNTYLVPAGAGGVNAPTTFTSVISNNSGFFDGSTLTFVASGLYYIGGFIKFIGLDPEIRVNSSLAAGGAINETQQFTIERVAGSPVVGLQVYVHGIFYIVAGDTLTLMNGWNTTSSGSMTITSVLTIYPIMGL